MLYRNKEKVNEYAALSIIQLVAEAGITLTLILVLLLKWEGRLISALVMSKLFVFFSLIKFYKWKLLPQKINFLQIKILFYS